MKNIINNHKKYIKAVIRRTLGADNQDIEQSVYIKIWQNLAKYQEEGKLKSWIGTVTKNICRDYFRSKVFKAENAEIDLDNADQVSALAVMPEQVIDCKRRQKIILDAVDALPKIYREVIVLCEFEELSLEQISLKLKIPVGTVKSRLHNGRNILKNKLSFLQKGE